MEKERNELLGVLESVKPGIANKDLIEAMTYFYFSGKSVVAYNDKISIQHPYETDFSLFVKADDLYRIISKLSVKTVKLSEGKGKLNISCSKFRASLSTIQNSEVKERIYNVQKSLRGKKFTKLPSNFCESILLCSFVASKQEAKQTLTCVKVDGKDCIASDNQRIAHAVLNGSVKGMLLKASEVKNLTDIKPTHYVISKGWVHFRNKEGCIFSIRRLEGKFPDFLPHFEFKGTKVDLPKDILEGMDIASVFVDNSDPSVKIKIAKGFCNVLIKSESGSAEYRSKIAYSGPEIIFSSNPEFIKQMMSHSTSIVIGDSKAKLNTDNFSLVTALQR